MEPPPSFSLLFSLPAYVPKPEDWVSRSKREDSIEKGFGRTVYFSMIFVVNMINWLKAGARVQRRQEQPTNGDKRHKE